MNLTVHIPDDAALALKAKMIRVVACHRVLCEVFGYIEKPTIHSLTSLANRDPGGNASARKE